jgi:propanediol utilization protein
VNASPDERSNAGPLRIPVTVSERHVHLTQDVIEQLFCDRYQLHEKSRASQPTQFAAQELVTLVGPRGRLPNVRVIGPPRSDNQVEISHSDARLLGIEAPMRPSGDVKDTPGVFIEGPRTCVRLDHGVIRALRHVHLHPAEAARIGLRDGDRIDVVRDEDRPHTLFCDVIVRVSGAFRSEFHLDAEEGGAAGLKSGAYVTLRVRPAEPV